MRQLWFAFALAVTVCACDAADAIVGGPAADVKAEGADVGRDIADQIDDEFDEHHELTLVSQTGSILHALNAQELALSDIVIKTLVRTDTRNLAYGLVIAHLQANVQLAEVMRAYGVGFVSTQAEAMLVAEAAAGAERLRATPPDQIDLAFLEIQIRMDAIADVMLDELETENDSDAMDEYIAGFHDMTDDHLKRAENIFEDLD